MIQLSARKLRDDQAAGFAPLGRGRLERQEREGWSPERRAAYGRTLAAAAEVKLAEARAAARRAELEMAALRTFERAPATASRVPFHARWGSPRNHAARAASRHQRVRDVSSREKHKRQARLLTSGLPSETHARVAAVVASWRAGGPELIPVSQLLRVLVTGARADRTLAGRRLQHRCLAVLPVDQPDRKLAAAWRAVAACFKDARAPSPALEALAVPAGYLKRLEADGLSPGRLMLDVVQGRRVLLALTAPGARWSWGGGPLVEVVDVLGPLLAQAVWPSWYPTAAPVEWPLLAPLAGLAYDEAAGELRAR